MEILIRKRHGTAYPERGGYTAATDLQAPVPALATTHHGGTPRTQARARQPGPANRLAAGRREPMAKIMIGKYDATIYTEGDGYTGAIDLGVDAKGRRRRVKRKGKTKAQVKDKLREAVADLEAGVTTDAGYTVQDAVTDFLQKGLKGRAKGTIDNYRSLADHNVIPQIGGIKVKELTADQLDDWLDERAEELSTRSLRLIHQIVERAIARPRHVTRYGATSRAWSMSPKAKKAGLQGDDAQARPSRSSKPSSPAPTGSRPTWSCPCSSGCPHRGGAGDHVGRGRSQGRHGGRLPVRAGQG